MKKQQNRPNVSSPWLWGIPWPPHLSIPILIRCEIIGIFISRRPSAHSPCISRVIDKSTHLLTTLTVQRLYRSSVVATQVTFWMIDNADHSVRAAIWPSGNNASKWARVVEFIPGSTSSVIGVYVLSVPHSSHWSWSCADLHPRVDGDFEQLPLLGVVSLLVTMKVFTVIFIISILLGEPPILRVNDTVKLLSLLVYDFGGDTASWSPVLFFVIDIIRIAPGPLLPPPEQSVEHYEKRKNEKINSPMRCSSNGMSLSNQTQAVMTG